MVQAKAKAKASVKKEKKEKQDIGNDEPQFLDEDYSTINPNTSNTNMTAQKI